MDSRHAQSTRPFRLLGVIAGAAVLAATSGCTGVTQGPEPGTTQSPGSPAAQSPGGTAPGETQRQSPGQAGSAPAAPQGPADIPTIVTNVQPSVVTVFTGRGGLGSGVVYSEDGLILTNEHVVRGSQNVEVGFADGRRVAGKVRATDEISDLALVEAERTGLPAAKFQTDLPRIGELAIVIGSPLGFENTVTSGIISG